MFSLVITDKTEVEIWEDGAEAPMLRQPNWPDQTPWKDVAEATNWGEIYLEALQNPESEFVAGNGPDSHPLPRPVIELDPETGLPVQPVGE